LQLICQLLALKALQVNILSNPPRVMIVFFFFKGGEDVPGESCRSPRRQLQKHLVDSGFHCRRS
jgi:hypothetical protein